uniref:HAUS augmin-like complex subunit 3 N-terminal domain-containing protein n=1 Tax=Podarcis muralis TaxID=64176 RepID=A0A670IMX3_PODMU
ASCIFDRGSEFVETLKFVYPKADGLQEKDFDWLFDCPETEQFLESFCNIVGEENVSSSTELEAYEKLVISGKPVLEGEALEQVLKTCRQASQLRCAMQENDTLPLETLEQEVQMLKSQCACRVKRRTKLQIRLASLKRELCHSAEKKEKASRELKKAHLRLEPENFQSNDALSQACKKVKELMQWHRKPASKRQEASMAAADLERCFKLEEKVTKALLGFSPKVLPDVVSDVEADQTVLVKRGQGDTWEKLNTGSMERREELERMALAYMCSQEKALVTSANIKGISYTLKWAGKALKAAKENKEQLCILQREVRQAKTKKLVPLLQTSASLLRLPVVCGELTLETRKLGHLVSMQEQAAGQMMVQWSHLELLWLLLMHEQKNLQQMKTQLEGMVATSNESHAKLQEWQACFEDSRFSIKQCPRTLIDPSDLTMLWEMLNRHSQDKQLFHAYGALAGWGSRLCQELRMLKVQLATPHSQLPKLESDNEVLHCLMYGDCNQLMLRAQVSKSCSPSCV